MVTIPTVERIECLSLYYFSFLWFSFQVERMMQERMQASEIFGERDLKREEAFAESARLK